MSGTNTSRLCGPQDLELTVQMDCQQSNYCLTGLLGTFVTVAEDDPMHFSVTGQQTHYVISEGQAELDPKISQASSQVHPDQLEQQAADPQAPAQYIITTTNGNGSSEVQIAKP